MRVEGTRVVYGEYGRSHQVDEDGFELNSRVVVVRRTVRGRPKKNEIAEGIKFEMSEELITLLHSWANSPNPFVFDDEEELEEN